MPDIVVILLIWMLPLVFLNVLYSVLIDLSYITRKFVEYLGTLYLIVRVLEIFVIHEELQ